MPSRIAPTRRRPAIVAVYRLLSSPSGRSKSNPASKGAPIISFQRASCSSVSAPLACSPATLQAARGLAANAIATWLARGECPPLEGKVQTLDIATWKVQEHVLIRLPYCAACGERDRGADATARPMVLEGRPKSFTSDGGHRVTTPEATLERHGRHKS